MNYVSRGLSEAFLAGPWELEALVDRAGRALGRRPRWLRPLVRRIMAAFAAGGRPRRVELCEFLEHDERLLAIVFDHNEDAPPITFCKADTPHAMTPAWGAPTTWTAPALTTVGELAGWLDISPAQLDWFADCKRLERLVASEKLRHYRYRWLAKRGGAVRLIEVPKPRLKTLQRRVLHGILDLIPPHAAAHGFRAARGVTTFVAPHVGRRIVLKMDLSNFFPSIAHARVLAVFRTIGYPEPVAKVLTGLCTNTVATDVCLAAPVADGRQHTRMLNAYGRAHLPQGAPTSPALANLCAFRFDGRLAGLARAAGADYTRYADDLVFSGDEALARASDRFHHYVASIALDEGFVVNNRKTRWMRQAARQRAAGVVLNVRPNIARTEFDILKATLHNCVRHGAASQNRDGHADFRAHLAGRIGWVATLNPDRARRLRELFARIGWDR
jgi:hypothetical protein